MPVTSSFDLEQWRFERGLLEKLLRDAEQAERAVLLDLGCPIDPVSVYAILAGEQPAPWSPKRSAKEKRRALEAMHALLSIGKVRMFVGLDDGNPNMAAYTAFQAGALATTTMRNASIRRQTKTAAKARGDQLTKKAATHDEAIWQLAKEYPAEGSSNAAKQAWIARKLKAQKKKQRKKQVMKSPRTISRRLARAPQKA